MINFTPPIKASLFVSLVYLVCFQLFLHTANYAWLYPANVMFFLCSVLYILFLNKTSQARLNMLVLTGKGIKLSFISALISLAGATIIFLLNFYFLEGSGSAHSLFKNAEEAVIIIFANSFLINLVCGGLAAFFTAGLMNEKKYETYSGKLHSLK
jgi:hypothetical protein